MVEPEAAPHDSGRSHKSVGLGRTECTGSGGRAAPPLQPAGRRHEEVGASTGEEGPVRRHAKKKLPQEFRRPQAEDQLQGELLFCVAKERYFFFTCACSHFVVTDFGRSIGDPIARLITSCDSMPIARLTENSTV